MILVVALGALVTRAPRLSFRPMHTDEAVHADKFGTLLETGNYAYTPHEYHGPTLNYFTLPAAWLSSARTYVEISEVTVRGVPVVFGTILILLSLFLVEGLGLAAVLVAVLAAISPAMFYYSRYYIQEMLLVCFTFGALVGGYRYARSKTLPWALMTGLCIGLMHATKETCIIAFGAMGLALGLVLVLQVLEGRSVREVLRGVRPLHLGLGLVTAVAVSALFYSSFCRHPRGILDSYLTYATYLGRAGGENTIHVHPWHYYLQMLLFAHYANGPIWTEGAIVLLALVGLFVALRGRAVGAIDGNLARFAAFYAIAMTVVYSAIPYKTPWCLLGFLHGMMLLAGIGVVALLTWIRKPLPRRIVMALLVIGAGHLAFQCYRGSFVYQADSRNPYVYAHPTEDIYTIAEKVKEYASAREGRSDVPIQVVCPGDDYWPLPWYLRAFKHKGWYSELPDKIGPLILISPSLEGALATKLYVETPPEERQMYMYLFDDPYYVWFRPKVKLKGFVRKDLWEESFQQRSDASELLEDARGR